MEEFRQATAVIHFTKLPGMGGGGGGVIRLLMFAGPDKSDYNFIPDAIDEREFM